MSEQLEENERLFSAHAEATGGASAPRVQTLGCDRVHFSYDDDDVALHDVTFEYTKGQIVGIVGPSGSGKSTLSQLLLRLRRPDAGQVLLNGTGAEEYDLDSWYERVTLVPQDPMLLHASVRDNISLLDPEMPEDIVVAAARAAGIHEVIEGLPQRYETLIGPSVRDLSGGQIQRIGIARAMARGAEVLVLDEPSSALDVHSEAIVQETLQSLRGDKLVFIIAHRLSTLSVCDRLLVLNGGRVEAEGPLAQVMETSPFFRQAMESGTLDIAAPG